MLELAVFGFLLISLLCTAVTIGAAVMAGKVAEPETDVNSFELTVHNAKPAPRVLPHPVGQR